MDQPDVGEPIATFDLGALRRFADLAVTTLAASREAIDALNVYPVPDGDTGTNMYLTMEAARDALREYLAEASAAPDLRTALARYARGALLGARGNSGVILSQLIGALMRHVASGTATDRSALLMAEGFAHASEAAYAAVGTPVEGTILTVSRAAAVAAAEAAADPANTLGVVLRAAAVAAEEAVARTPEQLATLRDAGVVDAGGRGLALVLAAAADAVTGRREVSGARLPTGGPREAVPAVTAGAAPSNASAPVVPTPLPGLPTGDLTADGPAYEVMYLLDAEDEQIPDLRARLMPLGDSLVVVGGEGLWNVHVHVDDVGAAIEAGIEAGRPRRIRVTHFAEQIDRARTRPTNRRGRAVVVAAAGPGLARVFADAGALVIPSAPGLRPSTGQFLDAIWQSGAAEVLLLPNDPDSVGVAEAAAVSAETDADVHVVVVPTKAQVQGLAAMAVHDPARSFDADVVSMTAAARGARHGAVTVAARQAITTAGPCEVGDALGVLQGDFAVVGSDLFEVACELLGRLLAAGGELVTLVDGGQDAELADRCEGWLSVHHPTVEVLRYEGGQERYPLLLGVE